MSKLNTEKWKTYKIQDIFSIELSKGDLKEGEQEKGNIPLISSGGKNNGVVDTIQNGDGKAQLFPKNTITVDMFCKAYYQPEDYYAVSHGRVNMLKPKFKMTKYIALFICTLINYELYRFCYGRAVYSNVIKSMDIKLPTKNNKPDWKYIEDYIKDISIEFPQWK